MALTRTGGWPGAPSSPKRKELTDSVSLYCTLYVYIIPSTMMEKSNDSVCSFSPSPLTHRQLNCQAPFPGSSFSRANTEFIHRRNPLLPLVFLFIFPPKSHQNTRSVHRRHAEHPNNSSLSTYKHTTRTAHTGNDSLLFLFCFCFVFSLVEMVN